MEREECPHCGREFKYLTQHVDKCVFAPAMWAAVRAVLDDGTGTIKPAKVYRAQQPPLSDATPANTFGTWRDVARAFGLRWYRCEDLNAPVGEDERWRDRLEPAGFAVCRVREVQTAGRTLLYMELR
jgi:hypothetical protein